MPASIQDQSKNSPGTNPAAAAQASAQLAYSGQEPKLESAGNKNKGHQQLSKWSRILLQTYIFLPIAILALEAFFNIAGIGQGEIVQPDAQLGCKHIAGKQVTWRLEGYSHDRLNSAGMRDIEHTLIKAPTLKRLAFLGDSYTEGLQVPLQDTFVRRLQTILNTSPEPGLSNGLPTGPQREQKCETLNFGCSSYSTGQELLQFNQQVAAYKPDLVVLLYTPGDSLENSVAPDKRAQAEARPYFYLDSKNQLQQDNGILTLNYDKLKPSPLREFLRANSTIFGAYNQTNLSLSMSDKVYFRTTRLITQIVSKIAAIWPRSRQNSSRQTGLVPPSWVLPDQLAVSEAIVRKLGRDVKASGGKLVVMTYPDLAQADPLYLNARSRLAKLAEAEGFGYLDLTSTFSQVKDPNSLFLKVHFSKAGHDLTAQALSTYFSRAGFLPN